MSLVPPAARARAEKTLVDSCVITRPTGDTFNGSTVVPGSPTAVAAGPCSLSPASSHDRTGSGGGDQLLGTHVLRLPVGLAGVGDIKSGDLVVVASDSRPFTVRSIESRTTEVLRRVHLVVATDAQQVPR